MKICQASDCIGCTEFAQCFKALGQKRLRLTTSNPWITRRIRARDLAHKDVFVIHGRPTGRE